MKLEALLNPKSVAVVGASRTPGKVGHAVIKNLVDGGFPGKLVPVNPNIDELLGLKCYSNPKEAGELDLGVICVPKPFVIQSIENCISAGARAIVTITAGFKEIGPEGAALEKEMAALCRKNQVRLLGPNCVGLINTHHNLNASFATRMPMQGNISVVSQSGALCTSILDWAASRHLGLAKLISIGNKADITEIDLFEALLKDEETKVIVAYLESIASGDAFIKVAQEVSSVKPVVIFKAGTTKTGKKAASSHTGSLAGGDIAFGAAFARGGVIRADTYEAMLDFATAFSMQPRPKGNRVAIITNAGGPGIMAADAVEHAGLRVAELAESTAAALKEQLPKAASVGNPIDVLGDADPSRYIKALNAAQDDDAVDSILILMSPQAMTRPAETALAIAENVRKTKPILAVFMGGEDMMPGRKQLVASNLPDFTSPEKAVMALKAMVDYSRWRDRPPRIITRFPVNRRRVERIIHRHIKTSRFQIGEIDAKEIMRAYNFNVPPGQLATTGDEAIDVAKRCGMPVAMKIVSRDIIHKSDFGGVKLNLATPDQVRDAFDLMTMRISQRFPKARIEGVYVEKMCAKGTEVIVGMNRDPQFGPMLMFGLGGIFVEVMKDVAFHLAPITKDEALQMLEATRSYALLRGIRGRTAVDIEAIAEGLQRISQLVTDFPQIAEMDINPFIIGPIGTDPIVADARFTLTEGKKD